MEHELLEEIADTLAFALHAIEIDESLHESEELIRDVAKFNWIWEVDSQGNLTYCIEKVEDFLGYTASEMLGKALTSFMPKNESVRFLKVFEKMAFEKINLT